MKKNNKFLLIFSLIVLVGFLIGWSTNAGSSVYLQQLLGRYPSGTSISKNSIIVGGGYVTSGGGGGYVTSGGGGGGSAGVWYCVVCPPSPPSPAINHPAVANAGPDKEVFEGQTVVLEGSGSDPDGDPITYNWSCNGGSLSNSNIAQPTFAAPIVSADTNYFCTLTVADNKGAGTSDSTQITVKDTKLYVSLSANPNSGRAPLKNVSLTATVLPSSTAIGLTANYKFWCNCFYAGADIDGAKANCLNQLGEHNWDYEKNGADPVSYTAQNICNYTNPAGGTYTPKVIVEKGLAAAAQAQTANITVLPDRPPQAINLNMNPSSCTNDCNSCLDSLHPIISWTFSDPDQSEGDSQTAYQVQISENNLFNPITLDSGKRVTSSQSYAASDGTLAFNRTYYWRVKVWDRIDVSSSWAVYSSYKTPIHAYPEMAFSWSPQKPNLGKEVQFTDQTKCYNVAGNQVFCSSWYWTFQDAAPGTSSDQNPVAAFSVKPGNKTVNLKTTDVDGLYCDASQTVVTTSALPKWREIIPW